MIYVSLTQAQREELTSLSRQAIGRVALRAHMVLLSDRGYSVPQIAAIHACGYDVVRTWLHRYQQEGAFGLLLVDGALLHRAHALSGTDFEDIVQIAYAVSAR
jgi:transposase